MVYFIHCHGLGGHRVWYTLYTAMAWEGTECGILYTLPWLGRAQRVVYFIHCHGLGGHRGWYTLDTAMIRRAQRVVYF